MLGLPVSTMKFAKDLKSEIEKDAVFNGAAALVFYLILAIFPALIFLLSLLPYLPIPNLEQAIMDFIGQALPGEASATLGGVVNDLISQPRGDLLSFGLLGTLWAASSGLAAIMQQLNITYGVTEKRPFFKVRGIALLLLLIFSILILSSFALIVLGGELQNYLAATLGLSDLVLTVFAILRWFIIFAMISLSFAIVYYLGPNVEQKFRFITPGSAFGAIAIAAASLGFKLYVTNFASYDKTYGSLGGVIILMLWLYVAGIVLLLGSEVNSLIEHYHPKGKEKGERTPPSDYQPSPA